MSQYLEYLPSHIIQPNAYLIPLYIQTTASSDLTTHHYLRFSFP